MEPGAIAVIVGIVLGILMRAVLPYLVAKKEAADRGEDLPLDTKFFVPPLITAIIGFCVAPLAIEAMPDNLDTIWAGFAYGSAWFTMTDFVRTAQKVMFS